MSCPAKNGETKEKIVVDGVELTVTSSFSSVSIERVVSKDRTRKPPIDITSGLTFMPNGVTVADIVKKLKRAAALPNCKVRLRLSLRMLRSCRVLQEHLHRFRIQRRPR